MCSSSFSRISLSSLWLDPVNCHAGIEVVDKLTEGNWCLERQVIYAENCFVPKCYFTHLLRRIPFTVAISDLSWLISLMQFCCSVWVVVNFSSSECTWLMLIFNSSIDFFIVSLISLREFWTDFGFLEVSNKNGDIYVWKYKKHILRSHKTIMTYIIEYIQYKIEYTPYKSNKIHRMLQE